MVLKNAVTVLHRGALAVGRVEICIQLFAEAQDGLGGPRTDWQAIEQWPVGWVVTGSEQVNGG